MPGIKLANGTAVKDVRVWDGTKWVSRIVKVNTDSGWVDCFRPTMFVDNTKNVSGAIRRSTTALISDGFKFNTNLSYTISSI